MDRRLIEGAELRQVVSQLQALSCDQQAICSGLTRDFLVDLDELASLFRQLEVPADRGKPETFLRKIQRACRLSRSLQIRSILATPIMAIAGTRR